MKTTKTITKFKDIAGNEINIGDYIIMWRPHYSGIIFGKVIRVTSKRIRVKYVNKWNGVIEKREIPNVIFVIQDQDEIARLIIEGKIKLWPQILFNLIPTKQNGL